jgi:hypothetical protein
VHHGGVGNQTRERNMEHVLTFPGRGGARQARAAATMPCAVKSTREHVPACPTGADKWAAAGMSGVNVLGKCGRRQY